MSELLMELTMEPTMEPAMESTTIAVRHECDFVCRFGKRNRRA